VCGTSFDARRDRYSCARVRRARQAAEWLCAAFGSEERLRICEHRAQLRFGDGAIIVNQRRARPDGCVSALSGHEITARVADVDAHYERAQAHDASIL
jgi:uncharacterized glyoxalase superfamily protein PhnB